MNIDQPIFPSKPRAYECFGYSLERPRPPIHVKPHTYSWNGEGRPPMDKFGICPEHLSQLERDIAEHYPEIQNMR